MICDICMTCMMALGSLCSGALPGLQLIIHRLHRSRALQPGSDAHAQTREAKSVADHILQRALYYLFIILQITSHMPRQRNSRVIKFSTFAWASAM